MAGSGDAANFVGGGSGSRSHLGLERGEFGLELRDEFLFAGDGTKSNNCLVETVAGKIEHGELEIGLGGEGGIGSGSDTGVDLT